MAIKAGLVGIGGYASTYRRLFKEFGKSGELEFAGIVVRPQDDIPEVSAELRAAGVRIYQDIDSMFASEKLDFVALPIGIGQHAPVAIKAVKAGINVIVEKPAAGSTAEVDDMIRAEKETGKILTVGFQHIYTDSIRKLKQELCSGKYGKIKNISVIGTGGRADAYYNRNNWVCRERGPAGEAVYDSPINNAFAHYLNLGLFLAGDTFESSTHISSIQAELYRARRNIETFDTCAVRFTSVNDTKIACFFTHATDSTIDQQIRIECEKATAHWHISENWEIRTVDGTVCASYTSSGKTPQNAMMTLLLDRLNGKDVMLCPLEIAKEHTFCIENMHRLFKPVELPESTFTIRKDDGLYIIEDIGDILWKCFETGKLPSERNVEWAVKSEEKMI